MAPGSTTSTVTLLLLLVASSTTLFFHGVRSDDASDKLFEGLNRYRASQKLPVFRKNENAECLAEQIVEQFEDQPCTNTTGAFTVQGTEQQFANYPDFLEECHLNASVTRDGAVMPACVPDLDSHLVLTNYTKTQYSKNLNKSQYAGVGMADVGDWMVVVLTTKTPTGNFDTAPGGSCILELSVAYHMLPVLLATFLVLLI